MKGYRRCVAHRSAPSADWSARARSALVLAVCGGDDDDTADGTAPRLAACRLQRPARPARRLTGDRLDRLARLDRLDRSAGSTGSTARSRRQTMARRSAAAPYHVVYSSNPSALDPVQGGSGGDHVSLYLFYDRLVDLAAEDLTPLPGLATEWAYTDPQTLELTLREGVTFHDGTPFDAAAVKVNLVPRGRA